jgi:hypothetical protein
LHFFRPLAEHPDLALGRSIEVAKQPYYLHGIITSASTINPLTLEEMIAIAEAL